MAETTGIQWTDATLNLWWGCVEVSPGCNHCYARTLSERFGRKVWGVHAPRYFTKNWRSTLNKVNRSAESLGERQRVFVQSMSDILEVLPEKHPDRNQMDELRAEFMVLIPTMPMLDFQLLTKRIGNVAKCVPPSWLKGKWPANAWMGISVVNQEEADRDIPKLLVVDCAVRFLSCEPLISEIDLTELGCRSLENAYGGESAYWKHIHWVIVGGESGNQARPCVIGHVRHIVRDCQAAGVPVFVKQFGCKPVNREGVPHPMRDNHGGDIAEFPGDLRVREFPEVTNA